MILGHIARMKKQRRVTVGLLFIGVTGWLVWMGFLVREPSYQGKLLTAWLEEYNRAEAMDKTRPVSEAIRAMGDRTLPFLLRYLKKKDSSLKLKLFLLTEKQRIIRFPPPRLDPYLSPALLALKALGPTARPVIPELLRMFENRATAREGGLALFSIGPESITAFQAACASTNSIVRTEAASFLALLPLGYSADQPYYCIWYRFRANSKPQAYVARPPDSYFNVNLASLARSHPQADVRRACVEALATYYGTRYGDHPEVVVLALRKALSDPDKRVGEAAREALKSHGLGGLEL
jgi:hypothetical protein